MQHVMSRALLTSLDLWSPGKMVKVNSNTTKSSFIIHEREVHTFCCFKTILVIVCSKLIKCDGNLSCRKYRTAIKSSKACSCNLDVEAQGAFDGNILIRIVNIDVIVID